MNLKETIIKSLMHYPTLYKNRTDVLHHLYIVLGCGFEWQNGKLVDKCDSFSGEPKKSREEAERLFRKTGEIESPYDFSELCNINHIPDDADVDYIAGAIEIYYALTDQGYSFSEELEKKISEFEKWHAAFILVEKEKTFNDRVAFIEKQINAYVDGQGDLHLYSTEKIKEAVRRLKPLDDKIKKYVRTGELDNA